MHDSLHTGLVCIAVHPQCAKPPPGRTRVSCTSCFIHWLFALRFWNEPASGSPCLCRPRLRSRLLLLIAGSVLQSKVCRPHEDSQITGFEDTR